jgi:hypothetical protein
MPSKNRGADFAETAMVMPLIWGAEYMMAIYIFMSFNRSDPKWANFLIY